MGPGTFKQTRIPRSRPPKAQFGSLFYLTYQCFGDLTEFTRPIPIGFLSISPFSSIDGNSKILSKADCQSSKVSRGNPISVAQRCAHIWNRSPENCMKELISEDDSGNFVSSILYPKVARSTVYGRHLAPPQMEKSCTILHHPQQPVSLNSLRNTLACTLRGGMGEVLF